MQNTNGTKSRRYTRKGSIIKFSILGALVFIVGLLSLISFEVPFISNGIYKFNSFTSRIKLGIDLRGGVYALYEAKDDKGADLGQRMDGTRSRLLGMLVSRGYTEATVTREGADRLRVEVPDVDDPQSIFNIIGRPAELLIKAEDTKDDDTIKGDKHITGASVTNAPGGGFAVNLNLNAEGSALFQKLTAANTGKTIQIITRIRNEDGTYEDNPPMNVNVNETISNGQVLIHGNMPKREDAQRLSDQIIAGSFSVRLSLLNTDIVSATLGERALSLAIIAGLIGIVLIMAYMIFVYRLMGLVSCFGLLLFLVLMAFLLYFVPWVQLTLPGVAGVIMTIGMAVDANVIVYERIKEEYRNGKSLNASVNSGYSRAVIGVVDANITTIIAAVSLMIFGIGSIQGFGIVLLIGVLTTMFSAVYMSQKMLRWLISLTKGDPKMFGLSREDGVKEVPDEASGDNSAPKGGLVFDGIN